MAQRLRFYYRVLSLVISLFCASSVLAQSGTVCRKSGLSGFETEESGARDYVSSTTSDVNKMKVYVTYNDRHVYLHSNFLTPGYEYATKIGFKNDGSELNLDVLTVQLVAAGEEDVRSKFESSSFQTAYKDNIQFILDQKAFASSAPLTINFGNPKNVWVACTDSQVRPALSYKKGNGEHSWFVKYGEHLYSRISTLDAPVGYKKLSDTQFDKAKIKIISLVKDTATSDAITSLLPANTKTDFDFSTKEALASIITANANNTIVALGHIENGAFVTHDSGGAEIFRIAISDLESLIKTSHGKFVALGCNSASLTSTAGVATTFNTVDAVRRLAGALESSTLLGFYSALARPTEHGKTLDLVIDDFADQFKVAAADHVGSTVYESPLRSAQQRPVGVVMGYLPSSSAVQSPTSSESSSPGDDSDSIVGWIVGAVVVFTIIVVVLKRKSS